MAVEQGVKPMKRGNEILATGRRKTAVARVRLRNGQGRIVINGKPLEEYFPAMKDRVIAAAPLLQSGRGDGLDLRIRVTGGGPAGQAGACSLGISRALKALDGDLLEMLRQGGLLTRDGRMKERKKYGLRGARRGTQFSKR
ncbi:MAG: 30S ribosomal protein S9 [Planctomycetaceae bacterium]